MFSWVKKQIFPALAGRGQLSLRNNSVISSTLSRAIDGFLNEFARTLDADDLHGRGIGFRRGDVGQGHPQAARSDAVAVKKPGMEGEYRFPACWAA